MECNGHVSVMNLTYASSFRVRREIAEEVIHKTSTVLVYDYFWPSLAS